MKTPTINSPVLPWFIPGFLLLAFVSLGCLLVAVAASQAPALMDAWQYRLLAFGWGASVVFAAAYHFAPMMTGAPLWSPGSGWIHLALHTLGLGLLVRGQITGEGAATGAMLMACGAGLFVLNFTATAGIKNQWTPANLLFVTSLLWLAVELVVTTHLAVNPKPRGLVRSPEWMARLAESALVLGFLWQATMAIALEAVKKHLAPARSSDGLAWAGFATLNLGLTAVFWLPDAGWGTSVQSALVVTGVFLLALVLAAALGASRVSTTPLAGFSVGLTTSGIILAACWPFQHSLGNGMGAALHVLGISWFCLAARLVPFAFAGETSRAFLAEHRMPSLVFGAMVSCLLMGVAALAGSGEGLRVGAALMLATIVWWFITLSPAWSRLWGGGSPLPSSTKQMASRPQTL